MLSVRVGKYVILNQRREANRALTFAMNNSLYRSVLKVVDKRQRKIDISMRQSREDIKHCVEERRGSREDTHTLCLLDSTHSTTQDVSFPTVLSRKSLDSCNTYNNTRAKVVGNGSEVKTQQTPPTRLSTHHACFVKFLHNGEIQVSRYFRHLLFIAVHLATFRENDEIVVLYRETFSSEVSNAIIENVKKWMAKLAADEGMELHGRAKRWLEIFQNYKEVRGRYLKAIQDEPLVYSANRIREYAKLYREIKPVPDKVLIVRDHILDDDGEPTFSEHGKALMKETYSVVFRKDHGAAMEALKHIAVESGGYVENKHTQITVKQVIEHFRKERGLPVDDNPEDVAFEEMQQDGHGLSEATQVRIALPSPVNLETDNVEV